MPTYHYACGDCPHEFEAFQAFADAALVTCEACGQDALSKVLYAPTVFDATPRTLGSQAERNCGPGRQYWVDAQRHKQEQTKAAARAAAAEQLPAGMTALDPSKAAKPWYRSTESPNLDLANLAPQQKANYMMTGDSRG